MERTDFCTSVPPHIHPPMAHVPCATTEAVIPDCPRGLYIMPSISHFTCHAMPIARLRLRADSWEMHARHNSRIHEILRLRDSTWNRGEVARQSLGGS